MLRLFNAAHYSALIYKALLFDIRGTQANSVGYARSQWTAMRGAPGLNLIGPELEELDQVIGNYEKGFADPAAVRRLTLAIEGKLTAEMANQKSLPAFYRDELEARVKGRGRLTAERIFEAHRRLDPAFVGAFLKRREIKSVGEPVFIHEMPLVKMRGIDQVIRGRNVYLKFGGDQRVSRGATNLLMGLLILGDDPASTRLFLASRLHHGPRVIQAAHDLGFSNITVYLPVNAPDEEERHLKEMGADVIRKGMAFEQAEELAREAACKSGGGGFFLPALDNAEGLAGKGTIAVEIDRQMGILAAGYYGLVAPSHLAASAAPYMHFLGRPTMAVEPEGHPLLAPSLELGRENPSPVFVGNSVSEGELYFRPVPGAGFADVLRMVGVTTVSREMTEGALLFLDQFRYHAKRHGADAVAALIYGGIGFDRPPFLGCRSVVVVFSGSTFRQDEVRKVKRTYGKYGWRGLHPDRRALGLTNAMRREGLLEGEGFGDLNDEGKWRRFVDTLFRFLPSGWDPMDALRYLYRKGSFGPIVDRSEKGVRETFGSLGRFVERHHGNKVQALFHPITSRVDPLGNNVFPMILDGRLNLEEAFQQFPPAQNIARLRAEIYFMECYLRGPRSWWERLYPDLPPEQRRAEKENIRRNVVPRLKVIRDRFEALLQTLARGEKNGGAVSLIGELDANEWAVPVLRHLASSGDPIASAFISGLRGATHLYWSLPKTF